MDWRRRPKPSPRTWGSGCGPFPGSRPRCPAFRLAGQGCCLAGSGPAAGGGGNGARALPPGDLPRGNGRGRPAAGVGGAACGAAGDQRRQAAAIPAAPLPPGGGGAGNGGPAGPRLQRGCFSGGHRHGGSGSEADRPQLEELQRRREEAEAAIAESARERDTLRTYADRLTAETARESAAERLLTDRDHCLLRGMGPGGAHGRRERPAGAPGLCLGGGGSRAGGVSGGAR